MSDRILIRFDRKTAVFLAALLLFLVLGTTFRINGSSIGVWSDILSDPNSRARVLLGTPKEIRSDEWDISTPAIISQARSHPPFSVANTAWGPGQVPMITNWPVRHWSLVFRPQFWGFFVLDLEHAFAFYWNLKAVLNVAGMFLLLMLLTENDFGISVVGAAWVFFSGYMQWWFSNGIAEMVGYFALLLVAIHYLVLSGHKWVIGLSALALLGCSLNFALMFYPIYQVPLFYLGIAILAGSIGPFLLKGASRDHLFFRITCSVFALLAIAVSLFLYCRDAKSAIDLMRGTVYPGRRVSTGGDLTLAHVFSGFFGLVMTEQNLPPRQWLGAFEAANICEASNFILLFPAPMAALLSRAWRRKAVSTLEWSLIIYIAVILAWITVGGPRIFAVVSGFGLSHDNRWFVGLGPASIFLCCVFLSKQRSDVPKEFGLKVALWLSLIALLVVFSLYFKYQTGGFGTAGEIGFVSVAIGSAAYLLLARERVGFALCILGPSIWFYGLINPVAVGLGPVLDAALFQKASRIVDRDPAARWTVYGNYLYADLIKATGAHVFNGTNFVPPLQALRILDPKASSAAVYNRYAHIVLRQAQDSEVSFNLIFTDAYAIRIDPKDDLWNQLGIRYVALPFKASDPEFLAKARLIETVAEPPLWIYNYQAAHTATQTRVARTIGQYAEARRLSYGSLETHNNLGVAPARRGKTGEAIGE